MINLSTIQIGTSRNEIIFSLPKILRHESVIPIKGCDSFVFCAILEFTLAQFLMRRQASKPTSEKMDGNSKTSIKKYQVKPFDSEVIDVENQNANNDQKSNIFMKIIGLDSYIEPIKGQFSLFANDLCQVMISEAHWVDEVSKRFFPIAFLIFNIVFWTHVNNQPAIENQLIEDGFIKF